MIINQNDNEKIGIAEYSESFPVYWYFTGTDYKYNETFISDNAKDYNTVSFLVEIILEYYTTLEILHK